MIFKCVSCQLRTALLRNIFVLNFSTSVIPKKIGSKTKKNQKIERLADEQKLPEKVVKIFTSDEERKILEAFPSNLLKKKPAPSSLYLVHPSTAKTITEKLKVYLNKDDTLVEVNPGLGLLTRELLKCDFKQLLVFESREDFLKNLLHLNSDPSGRVKVKNGDLINLWKLDFRDKLDQGRRVAELLSDLPKREYKDECNVKLLANVGLLTFFKQHINSLIFDRSLLSYGRCEFFVTVPPSVFIQLTCGNEAGYLLYRAVSILFQILFEYEFITRVPRLHFFPWSYNYNLEKTKKLAKIKSIDPEYLYLVRIVPRRNLHDLCSPENLQALWYFIKQNCMSRKSRIIPNLEKWAPGCGARLIIQQDKSEPVKELFPHIDASVLPKYSKPCTTMSNQDYYPNMDIFTEFGDLTPSQMLTLFCMFRSWPEYKDSSFPASLETSLLKMETSTQGDIDVFDINENEDDEDALDDGKPFERDPSTPS